MTVEHYTFRRCAVYLMNDDDACLVSRSGSIQFVSIESIDSEIEFIDERALPSEIVAAWDVECARREHVAERKAKADRAQRESDRELAAALADVVRSIAR